MIIFLRYRFEDTRVINRVPRKRSNQRGGEGKKEEKGKREREKGRKKVRKDASSVKSRDAEKFLPVVKLGIHKLRSIRDYLKFEETFASSGFLSRVSRASSIKSSLSDSLLAPFAFPFLSLSPRPTSFVPFDTFNRIASIIVITVVLLLRISRKNVTGSVVNRYSPVNKGR